LPGAKLLQKDIEEEDRKRKDRNKQVLDYFGEFIMFIFSISIILLFVSTFKTGINIYLLTFLIILLFSITFNDGLIIKSMEIISKGLSFLNKKLSFWKQKYE